MCAHRGALRGCGTRCVYVHAHTYTFIRRQTHVHVQITLASHTRGLRVSLHVCLHVALGTPRGPELPLSPRLPCLSNRKPPWERRLSWLECGQRCLLRHGQAWILPVTPSALAPRREGCRDRRRCNVSERVERPAGTAAAHEAAPNRPWGLRPSRSFLWGLGKSGPSPHGSASLGRQRLQ